MDTFTHLIETLKVAVTADDMAEVEDQASNAFEADEITLAELGEIETEIDRRFNSLSNDSD